jgi:hypothetical protein
VNEDKRPITHLGRHRPSMPRRTLAAAQGTTSRPVREE